jgi:hypothetical protein
MAIFMRNCLYRMMVAGVACVLGLSVSVAYADGTDQAATQIDPKDLVWKPNPNLPPGVETAVVYGDPTKAELFVFRAKWPAHTRGTPRTHPNDEYVTIIKGMWLTASGTVFDDSKLQALPTGGFYHLPAHVSQYSMTGDEETIIEVIGMGPWGVNFKATQNTDK